MPEIENGNGADNIDAVAMGSRAGVQLMFSFNDPHKERAYLKGRLAPAFPIFAQKGFDEGVAGQITVRARPDVNCVAHSHSVYGRAFSTLGRPLDITIQDACAFYNDIVHCKSFGGIVLEAEEGANIAKGLGNKKAAILANHGLLTCGKTVESTVFWFMSRETCCRVQLFADAAAAGRGGQVVKGNDQGAEYTYKTVGTDLVGWFSAKPTLFVIERESKEDHLG